MRVWMGRGLWVLALGFLAASAASFLGSLVVFFELLSHARVQLAGAGAGLALLCAALARPRLAGVMALAAAAHAAPVVSYATAGTAEAAASGLPLRVLTYNIRSIDTPWRELEDLLADEAPDIVVLTEIPSDYRRLLPGLTGWPHQALPARTGSFEVYVLSRWPITNVTEDRGVGRQYPVMALDVCPPGDGCLRLVALHARKPQPRPPWNAIRDGQLMRARDLAAAAPDGRVLLVGDLNLTPWSPVFAEMLTHARLHDTARGFAPAATFISRNPLFGLIIDHILAGDCLDVRDRRVGPSRGSDHFPVMVDLTLRPCPRV